MEKFVKLFADAIARESAVKMEDEFRNYDQWNSLAYLSLIAMIDEEYDTQIDMADFKKLRTVRAIYEACTKE